MKQIEVVAAMIHRHENNMKQYFRHCFDMKVQMWRPFVVMALWSLSSWDVTTYRYARPSCSMAIVLSTTSSLAYSVIWRSAISLTCKSLSASSCRRS